MLKLSGKHSFKKTSVSRSSVESASGPQSRRVDDVFYQLSEVTEYLLLGGAPAVTVERIRARGVTCVINAAQLPNLPVDPDVAYLRVSVDDNPTANLSAYFDSAADTVERHRRRGGRTLVHCVAGVSRSASLVLAHQIKHGNLSLKDAFQRLRQRRPVVRPNAGFFQQLIEFERRVRGSASVRMVRHPAGGGDLIPDVYESEYRRLIGWAEWLRHKNLGTCQHTEYGSLTSHSMQCFEIRSLERTILI